MNEANKSYILNKIGDRKNAIFGIGKHLCYYCGLYVEFFFAMDEKERFICLDDSTIEKNLHEEIMVYVKEILYNNSEIIPNKKTKSCYLSSERVERFREVAVEQPEGISKTIPKWFIVLIAKTLLNK